jgi:hypothetical protein
LTGPEKSREIKITRTWNKDPLMQRQEKFGNPRLIGYANGIAAFILVALWKFLIK